MFLLVFLTLILNLASDDAEQKKMKTDSIAEFLNTKSKVRQPQVSKIQDKILWNFSSCVVLKQQL